MWAIILVGIVVFLLYVLGTRPYKYWKKLGIPYIKPAPFVGNFGLNIIRQRAITDILDDCYNTYPDKRYVGLYQFLTPILMIRDPELIQKITIKDFNTFPEHKEFIPADLDPLWARNLFAMRGGEKWHDMRATVSPSFTSSKMRLMFELMNDCAKQFTKHFQEQGGTVTLDMKDTFTRFTNDLIATTAFGITCDSLKDRENEFYLMGKAATDFTGIRGLKFILGALSPTLMRVLNIGMFSAEVSRFFRGLIKEQVKVRQEKGIVRPDMIHILMEARKSRLKNEDSCNSVVDAGFAVVQESKLGKDPKRQKEEITEEDITAQSLIFFLGGFETASTFMCFTAHELAVNPDVQEKLIREVDQVLEDGKGEFTYESLLGMKYLDMVVTESLRKWPPAQSADRMSVKPYIIEPELPGEKSITLEKDINVWIPIHALHRDPKYYPDPDNFDPERFSEENKHNIKPFTYMPFGLGPRNCIGSRFALLEGKLAIAAILRKFEFVPVAKTQIPIRFHKGNVATSPIGGFWLGLKPRATAT